MLKEPTHLPNQVFTSYHQAKAAGAIVVVEYIPLYNSILSYSVIIITIIRGRMLQKKLYIIHPIYMNNTYEDRIL